MNRSVRDLLLITLIAALPLVAVAQTSEPTSEPTTNAITEPATDPTTLPSSEPTTNPTTEPTTNPTTEPATNPTTIPTTAQATSQPVATTMPSVPLVGTVEGTFFSNRTGRLIRSKDGRQIEFVFENDGKRIEVPILPNLELMRMENAIGEGGWDLQFRVSGWVTEYKGKNYILLDHAGRIEEKPNAEAESPKTEPGPIK